MEPAPRPPPAEQSHTLSAKDGSAPSLLRRLAWIFMVGILTTLLTVWAEELTYSVLSEAPPNPTEWAVGPAKVLVAAIGIIGGILAAGFGLRRGWPKAKWLPVAVTATIAFAACVLIVTWRSNAASHRIGVFKYALGTARQLSAAADQYFLENGVSFVDNARLVGSSNYVKAINPIAGETYPEYFTQGVTLTVKGVDGTIIVTYAP